jgi:A/G-specific adenine glycosylase
MKFKTQDEKIEFFKVKMLNWFGDNSRQFVWREKGLSDYQYIIAEILLQRTRAETVSRFYTSFVARFPSWGHLVSTELGEIEEFLRPIGLYRQKAKRLQNLAKEMVLRKGILPQTRSELETIPFMGQYISNAIELVIFKRPYPLLDVNMARVLERVFEPRKLADIRHDPYLQELAFEIVQHRASLSVNWAILDFAALICVARRPKCELCFLKQICNFYQRSVQR